MAYTGVVGLDAFWRKKEPGEFDGELVLEYERKRSG